MLVRLLASISTRILNRPGCRPGGAGRGLPGPAPGGRGDRPGCLRGRASRARRAAGPPAAGPGADGRPAALVDPPGERPLADAGADGDARRHTRPPGRLPDRARGGPRGHGRGVRGAAGLARSPGGAQGPADGRGDGPPPAPAVPARSQGGGLPAPHQHRAGPRGRLRAGRALLRHAVHRGPDPGRDHRRAAGARSSRREGETHRTARGGRNRC